MPQFPARPPILLGVNLIHNPDVDVEEIPAPVSEAVVDCAVYLAGERLAGTYTYAAALEKVHDLEAL